MERNSTTATTTTTTTTTKSLFRKGVTLLQNELGEDKSYWETVETELLQEEKGMIKRRKSDESYGREGGGVLGRGGGAMEKGQNDVRGKHKRDTTRFARFGCFS